MPSAQAGETAHDTPIPLSRPSTDAAELSAVAEVLESGWLAGQGPRAATLEAGFRELTGTGHAIAVNNCTAGLHLAIAALGAGPGDEVIVADYSFPATGHAVLYTGATPVFVDVRPDTATLDPALVEGSITSRTRGIVAVDALGMPADWDDLEEIASRHGLFLVEDAACAAGASYAGRPCGSFGDVAAFSLHARKGITCGEGGIVTTNNAALAAQARAAACFGMRSAYLRQDAAGLELPSFTALGYNYKLSDVLAAVAVVQLGKLDRFTARRRELADRYAVLLAGLPGVHAPVQPVDRLAVWQTYAVTLDASLDRDAIAMGLRARGIGCNIGTYAMHREPIYASTVDCPVSLRLLQQHMALPMFADLTEAEQDRVVDALAKVIAEQ
ncbi:MAG TPA: DegT/DnrJ/EryC1/StrS family aminotransferase [Micromonosporaceae bacterium]